MLVAALAWGQAPAKKTANPDDVIYDQVRLRLAGDAEVKGGAFDVSVENGVVTIKGKVERERAKQKAEKLAKKVKGVKSVNNQLVVEQRTAG